MRSKRTRSIVVFIALVALVEWWPTVRATESATNEMALVTRVQLDDGPVCALVVDEVNRRVFVSQPSLNVVSAFDFDGAPLMTFTDQPGACGMVLNGSDLYVAHGAADAIGRIDTASLSDEGTFATGLSNLRRLAMAGGRLWTTNGARLASVQLDGMVTTFEPATTWAANSPVFATTPARPNDLYVAEGGLSSGGLYRFDVSGDAPALLASNAQTNMTYPRQIAVSPDGTRLIAAPGSPYEFVEFSAVTLFPDGITYRPESGAIASAIAVSPAAGGLIATGMQGAYRPGDVQVFRLGEPGAVLTATTDSANPRPSIVSHGLGLTADGWRLFAVDEWGPSHGLNVLAGTQSPTATSVTATPSPSTYMQPVTFTATVDSADAEGTVDFYLDGAPEPLCAASPLVADGALARATCASGALDVGSHEVTAYYFSTSFGYLRSWGTMPHVVGRGSTALEATPTLLEVRGLRLHALNLQARLSTQGIGVGGRHVQFRSGRTAFCQAMTDTNGMARCTPILNPLATLAVIGAGGYRVEFAGDGDLLPSESSAPLIR